MSAAEAIYEANASKPYCDIGLHLPTLRFAANGNVFEIGVRGGCSTAALLLGVQKHGGHVWSVDVTDCSGIFADDPNWTFIHGHSVTDSARILGILPRPLDVLFIDSGHEYKLTGDELRLYAPLVRQSGMIIMHDTDLQMGAEGLAVRRALDEYAAEIGNTPTYTSGSFGLGILVP